MDNASDYGSEDSRFESWQDRYPFWLHNQVGKILVPMHKCDFEYKIVDEIHIFM